MGFYDDMAREIRAARERNDLDRVAELTTYAVHESADSPSDVFAKLTAALKRIR